ncbi:MAG: dipeptide epimerase [Verrucomicrobiota bacterium]
MRIEIKTVELRLRNPWKISRAAGSDVASTLILTLIDESGLRGHGEAAPIRRYGESVERLQTVLTEIRPKSDNDIVTAIENHGIFQSSAAARCALEVAWQDLRAKRRRQTVHDSFGLPFPQGNAVTSLSIGIDQPGVIREKVLAAAGFPILKLKVGSDSDRQNFQALREAAPEALVRIDANEAWADRETALRNIEAFAKDSRVEFVEQPMPSSASPEDCAWLKERSPLPIVADESYHSAEDAARIATGFHGVNVKLVKAGGLGPARDALQAARRAGLKTMLGCMVETSVLISAAAQLAGLCDYLDLDGNLLVSNDPFLGVQCHNGILSFDKAPERFGIQVALR